MKRALLQLQIQLEILGRVEIYLITSISGLSSEEIDFRAILCYISQFTLLTLCQKKARITKLKFPFVVDKT